MDSSELSVGWNLRAKPGQLKTGLVTRIARKQEHAVVTTKDLSRLAR